MRNIDLRAAYTQIYENRFAAHAGKDTDPGAKYAKPSKGGDKKGVYTMKGKDGKPLFDKREEVEAEGEQIDEIAPVIAAGVGKLAGAAAAKAGAGAAAKAGGGIAKAASSKMGKAALTKGGEMVGNKVTQKLSSEEVELEEEEGKKDACYKKVKASAKVWPSAYASGRLVQCRKKGADSYGKSKKEAAEIETDILDYLVETGVADTEQAATLVLTHMSDDWFDTIIDELYVDEEAEHKGRKLSHGGHAPRHVGGGAQGQGFYGKVRGPGASKPKGDEDERKAKADAAHKAERRAAAARRREGKPKAAEKSVGAVMNDAGLLGPVAKRNREKRKAVEAAKKAEAARKAKEG